MNPYIKHKLKNLWRYFLEFLGLFSLSSHIQNLQFLSDLVSAIVEHFQKIKEYVIAIVSFIGNAIEVYRGLIYPLFNIFSFHVPGVAVDFLLTLTLTASVSKLVFSRTSLQIKELADQRFDIVSKEFNAKFPENSNPKIIEMMKEMNMLAAGGMASYPLMTNMMFLKMVNSAHAGIIIFIFFITSYWIDLYYKTYLFPN